MPKNHDKKKTPGNKSIIIGENVVAYIGEIIGEKYKIVKRIGQGGMSMVYLVWDIRLNKQWAMKEIRKEGISDAVFYKSSFMEADVIKSCDHPMLPRIVDIVYEENVTFIVMDYIDGVALNVLLQKEGPQDCMIVVEWMKNICEALIYLHGLTPPIIYLDLKPANIILKSDGSIKLIDFGISSRMEEKREHIRYSMGTIGYASPEQMGERQDNERRYIDERSDIYSFGATMYTLITGKVPGAGGLCVDERVPEGIKRIIEKCMQFRREDRYQSFEEVLFNLSNYEKLAGEYRVACLKKIVVTVSLVLMSALCAMSSFIGYKGIKKSKEKTYEKMMTVAYEYVIEGDYEKALDTYTQVICDLDGNRNSAYFELLNLYTDYIDAPEEGISKVSYYLEKEHDEGIERAKILMKLGLVCMESERDYTKSIYYFELAYKEGYHEAEQYLNIAKVLGELNVDYGILTKNLEEFYKNSVKLTDVENKLDNYVLICEVLMKYGNDIEEGAEKLIECADKGLGLLSENKEEIVDAAYYLSFYQGMLSGCEMKGDKYINLDKELGNGYYTRALECCDSLLEMVADGDTVVMGAAKAYEYRKAKLLGKAELLGKLSMYDEACAIYEFAENEYGKDAKEFYVGHLTLLCELEEQITPDVEKWNRKRLCGLYEKAKEAEGIEEDYRWKRLSVKLMPIIGKGG